MGGKSHYYSENLSFYNFPYAFGGLFARGLYEKYKMEGGFPSKYEALLNATTVMSVEDLQNRQILIGRSTILENELESMKH